MSSSVDPGETAVPEISEPQKLDFDDPVRELDVRLVNGAVNVVGTDEPGVRVEIADIQGPPLVVRREGGRIVVAYDDLPWKGFLKLLDRKGWQRHAVVTVSVPAATRLSVGVIGASAVISGIRGSTAVRGVSGGTTLVGLSGEVRAETVSGGVEAQALRGPLRMSSVAGDLTVIDGDSTAMRADTVSGDMILDLEHAAGGTDIALTTVSGEIAVRFPGTADAQVEAGTAGGALSSAFDELRTAGQWGAQSLRGTLGSGAGRLRVKTVSGAVALLRRPPRDEFAPDEFAHDLRKDV
jgi:hypothetical protein